MIASFDHAAAAKPAASTGIPGLDDVLHGGFTANRLYLIEGIPGCGKTTLAVQFLLAGVQAGESVLYVTLSETEEELRAVAESHGWSLEGLSIQEVRPGDEALLSEDEYTIFHPSEIELSQTTASILSEVERVKPTRVVFDSLSEVRLLAGSPLRYRRQILALKRYFVDQHCTVLMLDDLVTQQQDLQVQSIVHGVIRLDQMNPEYGADRRRLRVAKFRGVAFRSGYHDYIIRRGGLDVFPRLVAAEHRQVAAGQKLRSGIEELDGLLGGGLEHGTSTLVAGPPGTGKSSLAAQFVTAACERGQRGAMFIFDEGIGTLLRRSENLGMHLQTQLDAGRLGIQQVDPAELSPGEFAHAVRRAVVEHKASVVVIDSLNGYLNAMPEEGFLTVRLHELISYLNQLNVATIIIAGQQGLIGAQMHSPIDASYVADGVILLRYFEAAGQVRQAISVVKKRSGWHERTIREFRLDGGGIRVGEALTEFHGVLTGVPVYRGQDSALIRDRRGP
jgi:circadian clock protein KaiC